MTVYIFETPRNSAVVITRAHAVPCALCAGKNPVTHAGKLYNLAASRIAASIVAELPETAAATCTIGAPIREPAMVDITIADRTRTRIDDIVRGELAHLDRLRDELVASHLTIS